MKETHRNREKTTSSVLFIILINLWLLCLLVGYYEKDELRMTLNLLAKYPDATFLGKTR